MAKQSIGVRSDESSRTKVSTVAHQVCLLGPKGAVHRVLLKTTRVRSGSQADVFLRKVANRCAEILRDEDVDQVQLVLYAGEAT